MPNGFVPLIRSGTAKPLRAVDLASQHTILRRFGTKWTAPSSWLMKTEIVRRLLDEEV